MSDYKITLDHHRRLTILRHLEAAAEYTSNVSILTDVVNHFGVSSSRDQIEGAVAWLAEQGFVVRYVTGDFTVVQATAQGVDLALGRARHPSVARPRPGVV